MIDFLSALMSVSPSTSRMGGVVGPGHETIVSMPHVHDVYL